MKRLITYLIGCAALALAQTQPPTIALTNPSATSVPAGGAVTFNVTAAHLANVAAMQWTYTAPGATITGPAGTAAQKNTYCAAAHCLLVGPNLNLITDGDVAAVTFSIPSSAAVGSQVTFGISAAATDPRSTSLGTDPPGVMVAPFTALVPVSITVAPPPLSPCDANQDGQITDADADLVRNAIMQAKKDPTYVIPEAYDLTGDRIVNVQDWQRFNYAARTGICKVGP